MLTSNWPALGRYEDDRRQRVRLPIGGLGTGSISIDGRGSLVDVEVTNTPAVGHTPSNLFFALRVADADGNATTRVLEGELFDHEYEGPHGSPSRQAGLPRFSECTFSASYPLARVDLADPAVPAEVAVETVNPLVPEDADGSGHPALLYRVRLANPTARALTVSVVGNLPNLIGADLHNAAWPGTRFDHEATADGSVLIGRNPCRDGSPADGTIALHTPGRQASSFRTSWLYRPGGDRLAEFWADFSDDGELRNFEHHDVPDTVGSLVVTETLDPGAETTLDFVLGWHFPYRRAWNHRAHLGERPSQHVVGNYYTTLSVDAGDAARQFGRAVPELLQQTTRFVDKIIGSGVPAIMADAALSNLAVLSTNTVFRTANGRFYGWEGTNDDSGSCHGSCTHVWNYEYALTALFPELIWSMRETEFIDSLDDRGMIGFRTGLPADLEGATWGYGAADGQMGSILRCYRTWRRTGDDDRLRSLWPAIRRAMEFAWIDGGWDADQDGVMEGCQHNTMDVEYYGPTPEVQSWYLGALAAAVEMANFAGETDFAERCQQLLRSGCRWMDENLFTGDYYRQQIIHPAPAGVAAGLALPVGDWDEPEDGYPPYQIGSGCTSDQLVGVTMAKLSGLEIPLDPGHVKAAMRTVATHNHLDGVDDHVNTKRIYALGRERGLVNASYPNGRELDYPYPYWAEVWTGLEYSAAVEFLLQGEDELALRTVTDVRDRYDGTRRNPFNEVECGHHYVRAMASWGLIEAWHHRQLSS